MVVLSRGGGEGRRSKPGVLGGSDQFGVAQSSHGRKKKEKQADDLNVNDEWQRRAQANTKDNMRQHHFNQKVKKSAAGKLATRRKTEKVVELDDNLSSDNFDNHHSPVSDSVNDVETYSPVNADTRPSFDFLVSPLNIPTAFSPPNSNNLCTSTISKDQRTTIIGDLKLTWPSYGIEHTTSAGERFSVVNACSIDTGLFILYHGFKTATGDFHEFLKSNILDAYKLLRHTFQLIETDGWNVARLH
ncbi:hypothetical protein I4U23_000118 [Adineta vaga]|nr:hypothetical protein I4U23_000118 [Adineta vaga]